MEFQALLRQAAAQGIVLLKNEERTLPYKPEDNIAIFGRGQINYYKSGTGSGGSVHVPFSVNLIDGIENLRKENRQVSSINIRLVEVYKEWIKANPFDAGTGEWASEPWCQIEMEISRDLAAESAKTSGKALYLIGRTAGEDKDNKKEPGSFFLTETERKNLEVLCNSFENVTVALNVSNIIDTSWLDATEFKGHIKGLLYSWQGGMQGGQGLADILFGKESPSGKLTDTIAYNVDDYSSTKNFGSAEDEIYAEDIYIGYRYFETFAKEKVQFPFGFGLSYTTFEISPMAFTHEKGHFQAEVKVTNTGSTSGREVVQIYCQAPQGKLGKPARILCGFAKTKTLAQGESQTVTISFSTKEISSYDDSGITGYENSYVLEAGTYTFYAGSDCRATKKLESNDGKDFEVSKTQQLEQLTQCCAPEKKFNRIKPGKILNNGLYEIAEEPVTLRKTDIGERIKKNMPAELKSTGSKALDFEDVKKDNSLLDSFVAQLSDKELTTLIRGEGMMSRKVTAGIASAFGGVSEALHAKKIPAVGCCDGPSGIRFDNGKEANLVPIGTLLACSWDPSIVEDVYEGLGQEMISKNCDVLLGPGCNIHRNPLNGRNFEYFSEDPLISGIMSVAVCKGLEKTGAIGTIKHFALNNQEEHRRTENSCISERALREIYLKPFEIAIKQGGALSVMTSYNGINGHKSASNFELNTEILRNEWGFDGVVMTDWWAAMNDCILGGSSTGRNVKEMVRARNDVYMVVVNDTADKGGFGDNLDEALATGDLTRGQVQICAKDILKFVLKTYAAKVPLRPLKNEIVVHSVLESVPEGAKLYKVEEVAEGKELENPVYYSLEKDGIYDVRGYFIKDGGDTLSQSITNVLINDEMCGSLECRSTDGKIVCSVAVQLYLKAGNYKLSLEHTKAGITVTGLTIWYEDDSPVTTGEYE